MSDFKTRLARALVKWNKKHHDTTTTAHFWLTDNHPSLMRMWTQGEYIDVWAGEASTPEETLDLFLERLEEAVGLGSEGKIFTDESGHKYRVTEEE